MERKTYCAFLRGVNVKGTNMKMAEACAVFEKAGMENVLSVLASGNILFTSAKGKNELKALLENAMSAYFSYEAFLFLKNKMEIETIFHKNPFEKHPDFHIYSFVGVKEIENTLMETYENVEKIDGENALIIASNFYWKVPKGNTLGSEFGKILGRKNLKDKFTSRNLNTFEKILKKI
ncbi:DUF1697 domain-containing protein [Polaribacter cellanae]|uniref:DUF1697 domain-containing protein n=1 Tax=Polaribacter cellanae TaxID=2818493 RepID=A0A975CP11_9FLAO|nr:DUF1697 domain-containing protein [Polaribacter cellanae]QTE23123.1 DUF1697 domain-containing protein [Polaribacter cellanae]